MGVVPFMCLILKAVIHTYREQMLLTGLYVLGDVMVVWHADVVLLAGSFSTEISEVGFTYIYRTKPMCTFKVQENLLFLSILSEYQFHVDTRQAPYTRTFGSDGHVPVGALPSYLVIVRDTRKFYFVLQAVQITIVQRSNFCTEVHKVRLESPGSGEIHFFCLG